MDGKSILHGLGLSFASLLLMFFFVFAHLFADGPSNPWHPEYLFAHGLTLAVYGVTAMLSARWGPLDPWVGGAILCLPVAPLLLLYQEPKAVHVVAKIIGVGVGSFGGAWAGMAWRSRSTGST